MTRYHGSSRITGVLRIKYDVIYSEILILEQQIITSTNPGLHFIFASIMKQFGRTFILILLAVIAAGSVSNAASATVMTVKMMTPYSVCTDMSDCDGSGNDNGSPVCDNICVMPSLAIMGGSDPAQLFQSDNSFFVLAVDAEDHTGPPDPYPPRILILN